MKTSELIGPALDWAVAKIQGYDCHFDDDVSGAWLVPQEGYLHDEKPLCRYQPSTNWSQGGPIIEREGIDIQQVFCYMEGSFSEPCGWQAIRHTKGGPINPPKQIADTPLIAAMRAFVASKLGDEVEIPDELK